MQQFWAASGHRGTQAAWRAPRFGWKIESKAEMLPNIVCQWLVGMPEMADSALLRTLVSMRLE